MTQATPALPDRRNAPQEPVRRPSPASARLTSDGLLRNLPRPFASAEAVIEWLKANLAHYA